MKTEELRILLIDDSEADYRLTKEYITLQDQYDIHMDWEATYENGLEKILKYDYDACLLDYDIGDKSGLDLAQTAREKGSVNPIILFSGLDKHSIQKLTNDNNAIQGFVSKDSLSGDSIIAEMQAILIESRDTDYSGENKAVQSFDEKHISQFILKNLPDPIMVLDENGNISMVNRILSELMVLPPDELLDVNASVFLNCTKEELLSAVENTAQDKQFRNPIKDTSKSNKKTHILWNFIKPETTPNKDFSIIAKGSLGRKHKKRQTSIGTIASFIGNLFSDPAYYKMNGVYIRKDTLK